MKTPSVAWAMLFLGTPFTFTLGGDEDMPSPFAGSDDNPAERAFPSVPSDEGGNAVGCGRVVIAATHILNSIVANRGVFVVDSVVLPVPGGILNTTCRQVEPCTLLQEGGTSCEST